MWDELDVPACGNPARGRVGRRAGIRGKPERGGGQAIAGGKLLGVWAATDIAVAYEDDTRHVLPADLLERAISPGQVFEPPQQQADEPAVTAEARPHADRVPS